jgi:hypothetical protein
VLAVILSKAMMLARDTTITDPPSRNRSAAERVLMPLNGQDRDSTVGNAIW